MSNPWTRELPTRPGIYDHRNLENAGGRAPIQARVMFVGYVNFPEDQKLGHGTKPMPLGSGKLRACRLEDPMTADSLTVQEWGGEWRRMDGLGPLPRGALVPDAGRRELTAPQQRCLQEILTNSYDAGYHDHLHGRQHRRDFGKVQLPHMVSIMADADRLAAADEVGVAVPQNTGTKGGS